MFDPKRILVIVAALAVLWGAGCGPTGSGGGNGCLDADGDGYKAFDAESCPAGNDCDDANPAVHPGADETAGDGVDADCDGQDDPPLITCAADARDGITDYYDIANIASHPGCSTEPPDPAVRGADEWYTPAQIPGYQCAAKMYAFPAGVSEDTSKPIVLLVHGNSDVPLTWEACQDGTSGTSVCLHHDPMVAETLTEQGIRTIAVDMRYDRVCDPGPDACDPEGNPARNMDHGWGVPIVQHFFKSVWEAYPDREFVIIAHSFGVTTSRDALRRLQCSGFNPWPRLRAFIGAAGGNHGVSTFDYGWCESYSHTMKGTVVCEFGSRASFAPTDFSRPVNGPDGDYEVPCKDGDSAYGVAGVCEGNVPSYHTIVIQDVGDGTFVDEFVSEASSALKGADNATIPLEAIDTSGYFFRDAVGTEPTDYGLLKGHFGSMRSAQAVDQIETWIRASSM